MIWDYVYPKILDDVEIHLMPRGGYAFKKAKPSGATPKRDMVALNTSACKLLLLCNGKNRAREIIKSMCEIENENSQTFIDGIYAFLEEAERKGHIKISDKPEPAVILTTGSFDTFYPVEIALELTTRCNMRCKHCYRDAGYGGEDWDTQSLKRLLIKFKSNGLRGVEITGGEPTLHPDFFEIVDFCSEQFDLVGILTNGYLIDENAVGKLSCYKEKIVMSVSLDGSTAEKHDSFRGIRSFDKVTRAIKLLSDSGIFVRATMSVSPENFGDIENTLLLAKKLGARVFGYSPIIPFGRGKDIAPYEITPEKAKEMTEMDLYIKRTYPDFLQTIPEGYLKEQLKNQPNCGAGYRNTTLAPDGNLRPCVMWPVPQIIGNVIKEPLEKIFSNSKAEYLSTLVSPREEACGKCERISFCKYCVVRGIYSYMEGNECNWAKTNGIGKNLSLGRD